MRELTYVDDVQVPASVASTVRDVLFAWHDPSADNYARHYRTEPAIDADGDAITDGDGNELHNVHIGASIENVPEGDIQTQMQNLVDAINSAFPSEWPTVDTGEVSIK